MRGLREGRHGGSPRCIWAAAQGRSDAELEGPTAEGFCAGLGTEFSLAREKTEHNRKMGARAGP